jgi:hypothetical protein
MDEGGGPAGVNDPADEGGGPAGVVEGLEAPKENWFAPFLFLLSGVDGGGLDENGTWKPDIFNMAHCRCGSQTNTNHHSNPSQSL